MVKAILQNLGYHWSISRCSVPYKAKSRSTSANPVKRQRAAGKATALAPVTALLALDSALKTFDISLDRFHKILSGDPITMSKTTLDAFDLLKQPAMVFFSDREGSQNLVINLLSCTVSFWLLNKINFKKYSRNLFRSTCIFGRISDDY